MSRFIKIIPSRHAILKLYKSSESKIKATKQEKQQISHKTIAITVEVKAKIVIF